MKKNIFFSIIAVILVISLYFFLGSSRVKDENIFVEVKKGDFEITVENSGEILAKNSVNINAPNGLRSAQVWRIRMASIIPEGTYVKEGDIVASLDPSELIDKLKNAQSELDKATSQFTQTKLDTTLELREARDKMVNLKYDQKEKKLELQQSKFEPPATIKKAEIALEKSQRAYNQALQNYKIKENKAIAKMQENGTTLAQMQRKVDFLQSLLDECRVKAPKEGMVIYARSWDGTRIREGSYVYNVVATLPDMSVMISKTYINEVDIRKVKVGQSVAVGLDAFPDKKLTGKVISVANVGEQRPNSDAKVFEVDIEIQEKDSIMLPAMTTSNIIMADAITDVLYIPLESIHDNGDQTSYVFKKEGSSLIRQQVMLGKSNENEIQVLKGLKQGDNVLISKPEKPEKYKLVKLERVNPTEKSSKQTLNSK